MLEEAFKDFAIPTAGEQPETGRQMIDHIALSPALECENVSSWSGADEGRKMSDHDGVSVEVSFTNQ